MSSKDKIKQAPKSKRLDASRRTLGRLWFELLPDEGKRDVANGQIEDWLKGTNVREEFVEGANEAADEWYVHQAYGYRVPAAGYDPAVG